jgi:arginase family enzyme
LNTTALFFPFDLFGSGGCGAGADALADGLREILADNRREQTPTRARAYQDLVRARRFAFERVRSYRSWRQRARRSVKRTWDAGDFLLWVAGNHLGVLPVYEELAAQTQDALVVQLDAHLDIQAFTGHSTEPSHANFMRHADTLPRVVNVGNRDLLIPSKEAGSFYQATFSAAALAVDPDPALHAVRAAAANASRVVIDIDCDVLDPAAFPAVTHAVPFGISPALLLRFLDAAWSDRLAGVALSEFDPGRDRNDQCLGLLLWLLEYILLRRHEALPLNETPAAHGGAV